LRRRCQAALGAVALIAALTGLWVPRAGAHELDAATLTLTEVAPSEFTVGWRASSRTLQDAQATAIAFPAPCKLAPPRLVCASPGLVGTLGFPWIEGTSTRVLVDVLWRDGSRVLAVASPSNPRLTFYGGRGGGLGALTAVVRDFLRLGFLHILTGLDHLFFVVALALLVRRGRRLIATVTAFTVAHSVSLALTVLGVVTLPAPPVEACIALSIVLVAAECLRSSQGEHSRREPTSAPNAPTPGDSLLARAPWAAAFGFGLLHGLGFASALLELGIPPAHVPAALLSFNLGVEVGQLAILGVLGALAVLVQSISHRLESAYHARPGSMPEALRVVVVYAIGSLAACWSLGRVLAVFGR
jgi:hypothetical protein